MEVFKYTAFIICLNKKCSRKKAKKAKCPECGGKLKMRFVKNVGHTQVALCKKCNRFFNTLQHFEPCPRCGEPRHFIPKEKEDFEAVYF